MFTPDTSQSLLCTHSEPPWNTFRRELTHLTELTVFFFVFIFFKLSTNFESFKRAPGKIMPLSFSYLELFSLFKSESKLWQEWNTGPLVTKSDGLPTRPTIIALTYTTGFIILVQLVQFDKRNLKIGKCRLSF